MPHLSYSLKQIIAFDEYTRMLGTFSSDAAPTVLDSAHRMMEAVKRDDWASYVGAAEANDKAIANLPAEELEALFEYLEVPKP